VFYIQYINCYIFIFLSMYLDLDLLYSGIYRSTFLDKQYIYVYVLHMAGCMATITNWCTLLILWRVSEADMKLAVFARRAI